MASTTQQQTLPTPEPLVRRWYVMQTKTPARETEHINSIYNKGKADDDPTRFEVFTPRMNMVRTNRENATRQSRSLFANLLFVRARRDDLHHYKLDRPTLRFYNVRMEGGQLRYLYVPDRQMHDFIRIATAAEQQVRYYTLDEGIFRRGDIVRIIGGVQVTDEGETRLLQGVEGMVEKTGRNSIRVRVILDGLGSVQTWDIHPQYVEYLQFADDKDTHSLAYDELERFQPRALTALQHWVGGTTEDTDRASCQIFLRRMRHARTVTALMQHKLRLSLLVCALILGDQTAQTEFRDQCQQALTNLTAPQLRAYTLLVLHLIHPNPDYLHQASDIICTWKDSPKLTPTQQQLITLHSLILNF